MVFSNADSAFSSLNTNFGDRLRFDKYFDSGATQPNSNVVRDYLANPYTNYLEENYLNYTRNLADPDSDLEKFRNTLDVSIDESLINNSNRLFSNINQTTKNIFSSFGNSVDKKLFDPSFVRTERDYLFRSLADDPFQLGTGTASYQAVKQSLDDLIWQDISHIPRNLTHLNGELDRYAREQSIKDTFNSIESTLPDVIQNSTAATNNLLDDMKFVNRPGILPAIGLIKGASRELYIDIYQLNNATVRNYIYNKILLDALDKNPNKNNIQFNFRLAAPVEGAAGQTTYDILGENLLFYRGVEQLKEIYGDKVNINFQFADSKSHPKFLLNQGKAIIGSMNLTNPLGQSIYGSGSNFEAIRVLHNKTDHDFGGMSIKTIEDLNLDPDSLMFAQAQRVMKDTFSHGPRSLSSGYANVHRPFEIYNQLATTLEFLDTQHYKHGKTTSFNAVLNQPFLLQFEQQLFEEKVLSGEMRTAFGKPEDIDPPYAGNRNAQKIKQYRTLQSSVLNQLIESRANIIVDHHNYRERVTNPIYRKKTGAESLSASAIR